ncbi:arginine/serine-rich coiled-coil protein 2 isoform X2 [Maniola jurtina]|uniref:arginine/serine-rich coiled-coil protein 2 isoform X2 n=1 Tax=Maniola jurtina TaxID=191418 RepID=UPI001E685D4E|nr:arginine/serine-rich coiled-coil protein 2 isoform X2 [Maniola jurtina]
MDSLVGYGSDDDGESGRYGYHISGGGAGARRREDDTNYDDVNMDMSEESQGAESEPELPPAAPPAPSQPVVTERRQSNDNRERDRSRSADRRGDKRRDRDRDRDRERPSERSRERNSRDRNSRDRNSRDRNSRERRSPRRDERYPRGPRRGLLGDHPDDNRTDARGPMAPQPQPLLRQPARAPDARDAVSPRFIDQRDRRDRDRERERDRDRDNRPNRRSEERRSVGSGTSSGGGAPRDRPRPSAAFPPPPHHAGPSDRERRGSPPSGDYRPSSYKVNKKLEVMEKMGLQIKTPDGSMATARQLRAAAQPAGAQSAYAIQSHRALDQVQKRKLLWGNKAAGAAEAEAAKWTGARFAQDSDGKQVSKFMRLMGIKDPAAVKVDTVDATQDPNKKQEELFQAMQAQYEVARATTHTMRGVGLGFQRGNF